MIAFIMSAQLMAQAPLTVNYQGVARNAAGQPYPAQVLQVRLSIHDITANGTVVYAETRLVATNSFGLFNVQIGSSGATIVTGSMAGINWLSGNKYLQTEIQLPNSSSFTDMGTTQMQSVPYAIHSREAQNLVFPYTKAMSTTGNMFSLSNDNGTGNAATIKAAANGGIALQGNSNDGTGVFGYSNNGTAMYAESTNGIGLWAYATGSQPAIMAQSGTGLALQTDGNIQITGGNTNPGAGKVLTSDAIGNATWQTAPGFQLPFTASGSYSNPAFTITNSHATTVNPTMRVNSKSGIAFYALSELSNAILGESKADASAGVYGRYSGTNSGYGVKGEVSTIGVGVFGKTGGEGYGVHGQAGPGGVAVMASGEAGGTAIKGITAGDGLAADFYNSSATGLALRVNGKINLGGSLLSPGAGKVLTSDASGNATWQNPSSNLPKVAFTVHDIQTTGVNNFARAVWSKVYFAAEDYDYNNNITLGVTTANSVFTAPIAGLYHFDAGVNWSEDGITTGLAFVKVAANGTQTTVKVNEFAETVQSNPAWVGSKFTTNISLDIKLAAGEKIFLQAYWNNGYTSGSTYTHMSLVGPNAGFGVARGNIFSGHLLIAD